MIKKIISFIVIIVSISMMAFIGFAKDTFSILFDKENTYVMEEACAIDRSGNSYIIKTEREENRAQSKQYMVCFDSTGRQSFKKEITDILGKDCFVEEMYCDYDKNIILTAYYMAPNNIQLNKVALYMFREDGSFVDCIFKSDINKYYYDNYSVITRLSDNDKSIFFGFLDGTKLQVFSTLKEEPDKLQRLYEYEIGEVAEYINAFCTLPTGEILISADQGNIIRGEAGELTDILKIRENTIIEDFWYGANQVWCRDVMSGDVFVAEQGIFNFNKAQSGDFLISSEEGLEFKDFKKISISSVGNVLGMIYDEDATQGGRAFLGGFSYLSEVTSKQDDVNSRFNLWLLFVALIVGIIIASLLLWEFYCDYMNMRLSIFFRQAVLATLVIVVAMYILNNQIIIPNYLQLEYKAKVNNEVKLGQTIQAIAEEQFINSSQDGNLLRKYDDFFSGYHQKQNDILSNNIELFSSRLYSELEKSGVDKNILNLSRIYLIGKQEDRYMVLSSNTYCEQGYPLDFLIANTKVEEWAEEVCEKTPILLKENLGHTGKELICLIKTNLEFEGTPIFIYMNLGIGSLVSDVEEVSKNAINFLNLVALMLVLAFVIIESITAINLRKLKKHVHTITAGDYDHEFKITSGDEIEELGEEIKLLGKDIREKQKSLDILSYLYHRFVPERFMNMLGENKIERLSKQLQAYREDAVILIIKFKFTIDVNKANTEEVFNNINTLLETIVPIINEYEGTVYNFSYDGFRAIFEENEAAAQSALKMRETIAIYNESHTQQQKVDVRIMITNGDIKLGFIGDETRMEPTAISDEANIGLEVLDICFDSDIYIACTKEYMSKLPKDTYRNRAVGHVMIWDKDVQIVDLFDGDPYTLIKDKEAYQMKFELGVNLFNKGDYENARSVFMDIIKYSRGDRTVSNYLYLSEYNIHSEDKIVTYLTVKQLDKMKRRHKI